MSTIQANNELVNSALQYASLGYPVFPCVPRQKRPLTENGLTDATTDENTIRAWWKVSPDANPAIVCRKLLVADFDRGISGIQSKELFEKEYQSLPATWAIRTGGGTLKEPHEQGLQLVYRLPDGVSLKPGAGKYGYEHFDIRTGESYIVAVPSITRLPYETLAGSPDNLAEAPQWLIEFVAKGGKPKNKTVTTSAGGQTPIPNGQRNATLTSLAGTMRRRGMGQEAITAALKATPCESPLSDKEIEAIAASVCRYEPGEPPTKTGDNRGKPESEPTPLKIVNLASVEAAKVSWLWNPYIASGKFNILEGDPGVGKSWITLAVATALSRNAPLPGNYPHNLTGPVLIASAEDGIADTIKPRLSLLGADTEYIHAIEGLFTLNEEGFTSLEEAISNTIPALLIIDPLVAYLSGDMDINKANQARYATSRLAAIAEKWNVAVLAVRHLTKGGTQKAIYRGLGSVDFTAAARSVLMAGSDPDDPSVRGIIHIKSNLAPTGEPVGYQLRPGDSIPFLWTSNCQLTAEKIMSNNENGASTLDETMEFLREILADGEIPAKEIFTEGENRGYSSATINRAKSKLNITAYHHGATGQKGGGKWYWKLPKTD